MKRINLQNDLPYYDIVVVGGGITGACVAYEAALRGLRVALFEKGDFGGATSAATSKLIHGGLRYLKNAEISLVRESLRERRILSNIAPNLLRPLEFVIPTYRDIKSNKWLLKAGMLAYDALSFDKASTWDEAQKLPSHQMLSWKEALRKEPNLPADGLSGAAVYYDVQNLHPERLTLTFLLSAVEQGAELANYMQVDDFITDGLNINGVEVRDVLNGQRKEISAKLVINCAGPWADEVIGYQNNSLVPEHLVKRSEGIHIITKKMGGDHAVALVTPSGRHIMVLPWRNHSIIGTTDKEYSGQPDNWKITSESVAELVAEFNACWGAESLSLSDVKFAYGGLRPLVADDTENSYNVSRKFEVVDHSDEGVHGLITVEGGKYTTSRHLAEQVVDLAGKKLLAKLPKSVSYKNYLYACHLPSLQDFFSELEKHYKDEFPPETIGYLGRLYGMKIHEVIRTCREKPEWQRPLNEDGEMLGQVVYALRNELAFTLTDVLLRRTGIGTLGKPSEEILTAILDVMKGHFSWDTSRCEKELQQVAQVYGWAK